ncbi:MAG TPA: GNAT family N-acetyltransferase [Reyranella sp.]|nr:GNAT family N-acetyltransferase [Reyranella sp.]
MAPYAFTRLTAGDLPLVRDWLGRPHVAEWWPEGSDEIAQVIAECDGGESGTVPYLVQLHDRPFAYVQCTREPSGVRGIDPFIGEADLLNSGHGSAFIRQFCDALFARSVPAVTTDPDPVNARAVRAYEKAGFRPIGPMDTPWGHVLLMQKDNAS